MHSALAFLNSTLAPASVSALVREGYGRSGACTLHYRGTHDSYRIQDGETSWYFRVYRCDLRSREEVLYEAAVLRHAAAQAVAVARPIARRDGDWLTAVDAPEGLRYAMLFAGAPGHPVSGDDATADHVMAYGRAIARFHVAMADFPSPGARHLSQSDLLDRPLQWLAPFLQHRPDDARTLAATVEALRTQLAGPTVSACPRGVCHGDLHGGNAHYEASGLVTLFDFDECGHGWLAYDLAAFHWMAERAGQLASWWPLLLAGYESVRPLAPAEHEAMPLFVLARHVWQLGYDAWDNRFGGMARADADISAVMQSLRDHGAGVLTP